MTKKKIKHIYTVSKLTREIKFLLEDAYPFIWITGEISNFVVPASGHAYFTLKDNKSVIPSVLFKNQKNSLKFSPESGMKIFGLARLSLYEPRGSYQLIFEHMEPEGAGSIQIAFEQLKTKLSQKGFFDEKFKKTIPFLPAKICVITSGTGAAVKDIIQISQRRFPNCNLDILPVKVQGDYASGEICEALQLAQNQSIPDVIILARGGGSLEDLQAFNSEQVAKAIFKCTIPVITGIGHETDYTIADFVADLRAPTPSAAAELAVPDKQHLLDKLNKLNDRLNTSLNLKLQIAKEKTLALALRLKTPELIIYNHRFLLEDYQFRLSNRIKHIFESNQKKYNWLNKSLCSNRPVRKIDSYKQNLEHLIRQLTDQFQNSLHQNQTDLKQASARLEALNPHQVLKRGYSISRTIPGKKLIKNAEDVHTQDRIEVILSNGRLITKVEQTHG
ncbi:MAG: exodeoxyribonuclease VII large subunit [Desulfobacula sp.]|nr:exodeoxyribonuclease VII large subunit [Desulfobacula sp.]